ncbi:hypothetical protein [Aureivirga sp. CE67]|nr:hypothetical protein [Aureivirga sp. CE67]
MQFKTSYVGSGKFVDKEAKSLPEVLSFLSANSLIELLLHY